MSAPSTPNTASTSTAVPTFDQFIEPLLRVLVAHPQGLTAKEAHEKVAEHVGLSVEQRAELVPSGVQPKYKGRIGWAHDRLKRAGYSECPRRGFWQLTDNGRTIASITPEFTPEQIAELAFAPRDSSASGLDDNGDPRGDATSPDERIESALLELRESVAVDLLETIARCSPTFFEHLVLDLLHAMGYGADRSALQRVGGSGDGGIDGIISLDRLGLEKVYVQAKRWQGSVGSPEIQKFIGSLSLEGASKGVFITTSAFTRDALESAQRARGVVLVNGTRLANLMIDHHVGVSSKAIKVPKIDSDYFEDG